MRKKPINSPADGRRLKRVVSLPRVSATTFPVGVFILEELKARRWTLDELSKRMGGDAVTRLTLKLLIHAPTKGATLGRETAARLARAFGTSKTIWLKLDDAWQAND